MSERDLSIIMPLYNAAEYVEAAIQSALENADGLLELIVVDDGSTDGGAEIAAAQGELVRVISQENAGPSAARNRGVSEARGKLIGFLDSDDLWSAARPDPRRPALAAGADVVYGRIQVVVGDPPVPYRWESPSFQFGAMLTTPAVLAEYPLDDGIVHGEDLEWMLRVRDAGLKVELIEARVFDYRQRVDSLSRTDREASRSAVPRLLHESLMRKRKASANE
jgi:glycosyltransferase involved in cell wall biosynthesis